MTEDQQAAVNAVHEHANALNEAMKSAWRLGIKGHMVTRKRSDILHGLVVVDVSLTMPLEPQPNGEAP